MGSDRRQLFKRPKASPSLWMPGREQWGSCACQAALAWVWHQ